ncbi:MFS transporter [Paenibacillus chartarius]|uniref:MFS transporter n=1 Tax=Paenibacillus chartarius TaxID=747481 RepID=A0ABV6DKK4_9BACL
MILQRTAKNNDKVRLKEMKAMEASAAKNVKTALFSPFVIKLLVIMFVVEFVKGALLLTILPVYMAVVLGASAYAIGWTLAAQYIGDNALRAPVGWIIDRIGYRACMLSGVLVTFASVVIIAVAGHYAWTITACALLGLGTAPLWPCVITGATEVAGDEGKGTVLSVVHLAWLSGTGIGPVVINFFLKGSEFGPAFRILLGCMTVVVVVALLLPGRKQREAERAANMDGDGSKGNGKGWLEHASAYFREVRASLTVSPLLFPAMFLQTFAIGILSPILTLYARQELSLTPTQFSLFLIAGGAVTVVLLVPVGKLVDKYGTKFFLAAGFGLGAATLFLFTFTRSLYVLYGYVTLIGMAYACIIPAWNVLIAAAVPEEKRGAIWGFFLTIEGLGSVIGPIVSGKLWDVFGPRVPFMTSGGVLALLFVLQLLLVQRSGKEERMKAG